MSSDLFPKKKLQDPTIEAYYRLLESKIPTKKFYAEMTSYISLQPYFFAPYIDAVSFPLWVGGDRCG
jgi:hypothetical protein